MFLMYVLGFFITYISLVILMKDSLVDRDVVDNIDLYITVFCLSAVFPIILILALANVSTQRILGLFKKVNKK